ncbi:RNA polymerase sigma factor [Echinicola vietnamensis]|uniref:RNA polymerase sigma-70 factor, expansion family 1 n=1 Tax=Echinicola vietnamensis (strain DSM 17526 / LMG 23754 / KMM 6221) TaxID=926556 RepID=L0G3C5_ECHVK|nr:RNA polymerase sigma-70 factor [Echinicola vietnamensis]AGA80739.1 RNA polymerase sigma-70 factor, expansion family 1 [Echinicola vietnamensis DSM 17526]
MDLHSDEQLYQRLKQADHRAFDLLFDRYWKRLFEYAYKMLQDREQAEDVVQEVFVQLWENASNREIQHLSGYFFRAVKYQVANTVRNKKWHVDWDSLELEGIMLTEETEQPQDTKLLQQLEQRIEQLPPKCKEIFYLNKKHGYTAKEIAASLNISPRTVEGHLQRALKSLKADLDQIALFVLIFLYP